MRVLITAGGTREKIDSVRSITNHATGRLGAAIAEEFAAAGWEITYLHGEGAALTSRAELVPVGDTRSLMETLESLLTSRKYDCVIHSMAVSDYTARAVCDIDGLVAAITGALRGREVTEAIVREAILSGGEPAGRGKVSSEHEELALFLRRTPKVIGYIKKWQPETALVGFKLLSGVTEDALLAAGRELMRKNACDYVLANDLAHIHGGVHQAILLGKDGTMDRAGTKKEIAALLYRRVSGETAK